MNEQHVDQGKLLDKLCQRNMTPSIRLVEHAPRHIQGRSKVPSWQPKAPLKDANMVNVKGHATKEGVVYHAAQDLWKDMPHGMLYDWTKLVAAMYEDLMFVVDQAKGNNFGPILYSFGP
ncbi:hypothetical protein Fmac_024772 [Flemingia macrophylla]|uniref:Uncharacterized protein n=1 Tax=Flemingia macrophylla TaxID=520843 RepID=A0ABD1LQD6_9FABA